MKRIVLIAISFLCLGFFAKAENTNLTQNENVVFAKDLSGVAGTTVTLTIEMNNTQQITGFQFDLVLPAGVTVATDADGFYLAELSTDRTTVKKTDYFNSAKQADGSIRVMCSSTKSIPFSGNTGKVATIQLVLDGNMAAGNYPIVLKDEVLSFSDASGCKIARVESNLTITPKDGWICTHVRGDANGDGRVDISDVTTVVNIILGKE
ncbi:MAG: hypothetical protein IJR02_05730 [Bacteroidaceae bacterium]|nr:hypothetical protein [Bacteroidaceae bacterium]